MPTTKYVTYAKLPQVMDPPNMVDVQTQSYEEFLQFATPRTKRLNQGLQAVFLETFPIESYDGKFKLEFLHYTLGKPKYNVEECRQRAMSYAAPLS